MKNNRIAKEIRINKGNFTILYGTLNAERPDIIYVRAKTKVTPTSEKSSVADDIMNIKKGLSTFITKTIHENSVFDDKHIYQIDVNENGIVYKKNSFIKYELYLKPKELMSMEQYKNTIAEMTDTINERIGRLLTMNGMEYSTK